MNPLTVTRPYPLPARRRVLSAGGSRLLLAGLFTLPALSGVAGCSTLGLTSPEPCELDNARERRLDAETEAQILVGRTLRMRAGGDDTFQVLAADGRPGRPTAVVLHGPGRSPADGLPQQLLILLNELGYSILVPQMPVQQRSCESPDTYPQTFSKAFGRIDHLLRWIAEQGNGPPVLIGSWLADAYLARRPRAHLLAWVVPNLTGGFSWIEQPGLRVLDVYGERAVAMTLNAATRRRLALARFGRSKQVQIAGADMEFNGHHEALARLIDAFVSDRD